MPTAIVHALLGGVLIGLGASALLVLEGRLAGISGILGGLLRPRPGEVSWRAAFLAGLLAGGLLLAWRSPQVLVSHAGGTPLGILAVAGLLVGFGTQLGGGCTSGHGVCGVSRGSRRSIVAVVTFMAAGALAVFVTRHIVPRLG